MSLLRDIQDSAIDGSTDLETLLRKCRVLAARLKNDDFKYWVQAELDGYAGSLDVPGYRTFHCHCYGHFAGAFREQMRNAPIPEMCIPDDCREALTTISIRDGVSSLSDLAKNCTEDGIFKSEWPADAYSMFGRDIYERMNLMQAWMVIPKSSIVGILSTVRNRILNFAIEIEEANPDAGEATPGSTPVPKETISQIFNNFIYGNVGNLASGKNIHQTATMFVQEGDFSSLSEALRKQGIDKAEIKDLKRAIENDPEPMAANKTFGKHVSAWIGKMIQKSAEGIWKIGTTVAADLLTKAIKSYYGIPPTS